MSNILKKAILLCGGCCLLSSSVVFADVQTDVDETLDDSYEEQTSFSERFYLQGSMGVSRLNYSGTRYTSALNSYDANSCWAMHVGVGYNFAPYLAGEFGCTYYGSPKIEGEKGNTQSFNQWGIDLAVRATVPLSHQFNWFVKTGTALIRRGALDSKGGTFSPVHANTRLTFLVGSGISYDLTPQLAIDVAWIRTLNMRDLPTTDVVGIGVTYKIKV